jgi:hypothetical protein
MARFGPHVRDLAVSTRALIEDVYPQSGGGAVTEAERRRLRRRPEEDERALLLRRFPQGPREPGLQSGRGVARPGGAVGGPREDAAPREDRGAEDLENPALRPLLEAAKAHREATRPARRGEEA